MKLAIIEGPWPTLLQMGPDIEQDVLGERHCVHSFATPSQTQLQEILQTYHAIIARPGFPITKDLIVKMKRMKVVVALGVGFDHICLDTSKLKNIPVCNVPDYCTDEVA